MNFLELIKNSRPENTNMAIFTQLIVMNQADAFTLNNNVNSIANEDAMSIARDYSIALNQAASVFNVFPPLIDFTAHLWAKNISERITSQFPIDKDEFAFTRTGLLFIQVEEAKVDQIAKEHGVHFDDLIDLNLFVYSKICDDLSFKVNNKDHCFHLDPNYQGVLISILKDCLNYNVQTLETAISLKSSLVENSL